MFAPEGPLREHLMGQHPPRRWAGAVRGGGCRECILPGNSRADTQVTLLGGQELALEGVGEDGGGRGEVFSRLGRRSELGWEEEWVYSGNMLLMFYSPP